MTGERPARSDPAALQHDADRVAYWNAVAVARDRWRGFGGYYHRRLARVYRHLVAPGQRVLELGCGEGDLLAALEPSVGVGVDFATEMIGRARRRHPTLRFIEGDAHELDLSETFDVIVMSDLANELWDVQGLLERLRRCCHRRTRLVLNFYNRMWQPPLALVRLLRMARPTLDQSWLHREDMRSLLHLAGFEMVRTRTEILLPVPVPVLSALFNRVLARVWPFRLLALAHIVVARPVGLASPADMPRVTVVVPARNEEGNIEAVVDRVPEMCGGTELIFVEGHSRDNTPDAIERAVAAHPERRCVMLRQTGQGKGDAVRLGFAHATGDIVIILDADLTVPPEDLPRFVDALIGGRAELVNGVRLVYPMEGQAMRFANLIGNRFFNLAFSWLLEQPVKDTLCGTKALWRSDYELIAANRTYLGDLDPFGDFDLLFGAARLSLRIVDLPVRYRARTYGETNIRRWSHGLLLIRMVARAAGRLKFV
jgi:ubiquinone/menaquinone biosynthesis C-methylase UbiE